jgi:hypothetical protein
MFWHALVLGKTLAQNRNVLGFICFLEEIFVSQRQRRLKKFSDKRKFLEGKVFKGKGIKTTFLSFLLRIKDWLLNEAR